MIKSKVENFIKKYNLSGTFIVAFSGGYDSMCLLDILHKLRFNLVAVHLNHNWRGAESSAEAAKCEQFAKARGITFYSEILPDSVKKTETVARDERYKFFKRCAEKFHSNVVFTAHNFDDNAETVIYRIIKGTGPVGLQGIAEQRDIFYRPLLDVCREDIEQYCEENSLEPNVDSSNFDTEYNRNFIRHEILPLMKKINPKAVSAINSLSSIMKENCEKKAEIRDLLAKHNIDYDNKKIEQIYEFMEENKNSKSGKTLSLTNGLWLFVSENLIDVITKFDKDSAEIKISECGEYKFGNSVFSIEPFVADDVINFPLDTSCEAFIEVDRIDFTLRYRKDGDKISPLGSGGSQKLKKYFNEKKIPQHLKDKVILLCDDTEVLWVAGYGISERLKVKSRPTHVIKLR